MSESYLQKNLERLNAHYGPQGIQFELAGPIVKVLEEEDGLLNAKPYLKEELNDRYTLSYNWKQKFRYINEIGKKNLERRLIKLEVGTPIEKLKEKIHRFIDAINDPDLKESILALIQERPVFYSAPAAKNKHHAYPGGLLEHSYQVIKIGVDLMANLAGENNIQLDKDLIIAGGLLHDIGKLDCYEYIEQQIDVTATYFEQEHIVKGIAMVAEKIRGPKKDALIHIIASHHQLPEWGSPVKPVRAEAWIIHYADDFSSKTMG
jgi:3'-5' exoribonuclease